MRVLKDEAKHYLETNIHGAYETVDVSWQSDFEGKKHRAFEDTEIIQNDEVSFITERKMVVNGKSFTVCSIFPFEAERNPTDKMLKIIGMDLEKQE